MQAVLALIQAPDARSDDNELCFDNAVSGGFSSVLLLQGETQRALPATCRDGWRVRKAVTRLVHDHPLQRWASCARL